MVIPLRLLIVSVLNMKKIKRKFIRNILKSKIKVGEREFKTASTAMYYAKLIAERNNV